jgi:S1-C subfamily serine protease
LVNLNGELIGINTRLVIGPQETPSGQAYGLAIPGNEVQEAYERMIHKGRPRGYVGVTVDDWPVASYQTGRRPECAVVVGVDKGSPAAAAGLRKDDLIRALDGEPVRSSAEFFRRLRKRQVGDALALEITRAAEALTPKVEVVDLKSIFEKEEMPESRIVAGLTVRGLRRTERMRLALPDSGGVLIEAVAEDSPLHGKVAAGEVILRVTDQAMEPDQRVQNIAVFSQRMEALTGGGYVDVLRAKGSVDRLTFSAKELRR